MRFTVFALALLILGGCGSELTGPSPERYRLPRLIAYCNPAGEAVSCSATLHDVPAFRDSRDVTQTADWSVLPADIGTFAAPGVLVPATFGEAEIRVRSEGIENGGPLRFLIGPGRPARWLYFFSPSVRETDNTTVVSSALVEMLDGYQSGQRCTTDAAGLCRIDRVLTGETFTVRVSKAGYRTVTTAYRVDPPVGPAGNPPSLVVLLARGD